MTIKAVAYQENMQLSQVGTYSYVVDTVPAAEAKKAEEERLAEDGYKRQQSIGAMKVMMWSAICWATAQRTPDRRTALASSAEA